MERNSNSIIAGIVLYNPDIIFLKKNIEILKVNNIKTVLFDNTEYEDEKNNVINKLDDKDIIYISENKNLGMSIALNRIMGIAKKNSYKWCITFDQDTEIPENIIKEYSKYLDDENIAILTPQLMDKRRKYMKLYEGDDEYTLINQAITSASCTRVDVWEEVGKYDEKLFIDLVDTDFSKRCIAKKYDIYRINSVILNQQFGDIQYKDNAIGRFWLKMAKVFKDDRIGKLSYKKKVNPLRIYYTNRNIVYLNERLKKIGGIGYENYKCKNYFSFFVLFNFLSIARGKKKIKIIKAVHKGRKDGKKLAKECKKSNNYFE